MRTKQRAIINWRLGLLALLASAISLGFNGQGCNLTTNDSNSGSSTVLIIKANSPSVVGDDNHRPDSEINVPAQAVDSDTEVSFIPFRQKEDLPEPLPDGCEFLGGANIKPKHQERVNFHNGKEADCYVILPDNVRAEEISNINIRLMEFIDDQWVIVLPDKKGKVHTDGPKTGYIGPDESAPAKLTGIRPFCWALIKDPAIIQSLYNLWLTISANPATGGATPILSVPPVLNTNSPTTQPVIAPPPAVIIPPAPVTYGPNWILMKPASAPSARFVYAMAYDSARQRTVIFGGTTTGYDKLSDTWEWDGINWTKKRPANSPSIRGYLAMAYDSARQKTVLFGGGYYGSVYYNDTWEWDGINWTLRTPTTKPPARTDHSMVYDSARQRIILFGGFYEGTSLNDTWEWDSTNWTLRSPATSPPGRHYHSMAYDSARQKTILFGGENSTATHIRNNETWEWDGTNWTLKSPINKPTARAASAMAYDTLRQKTILFGGDSNADTWEWDGTNWMQKAPVNNPSIRSGHLMVYDSARQRIVLFGGGIAPRVSSNETWEYGMLASNYAPTTTLGPIAWWKFDDIEGTTAFDSSGNNNHGRVYGATWSGNALSFDGVDDYVRVPNAPALNPQGSFSIDAWIFPTTDRYGHILAKWGDTGDWSGQRAYALSTSSGRLVFGISDDVHQQDSQFHVFSTQNGIFTLNRWNHMTTVYDKSTGTRKVYVNGTKIDERTDAPVNLTMSVADIAIGGHLASSTILRATFFQGLIDEVKIYNYARSATEIQADYDTTSH